MNQSYFVLILWIGAISLIGLVVLAYKSFSRKTSFRYKPKGPYLLSKGEKAFFDVLVQSISSDLYVCPKVRVADLIEVDLPKSDKYFWASFNKIAKKHVDFVLCSRTDFSPKLIVELDGGSHRHYSRSQRDLFIDAAFAQVGITLLHIPTRGYYEQKQLADQVLRALSDESQCKN